MLHACMNQVLHIQYTYMGTFFVPFIFIHYHIIFFISYESHNKTVLEKVLPCILDLLLLKITFIVCPLSHTQTFNLRPKIIKNIKIWIILCWKLWSDQRNKTIVAMCIVWKGFEYICIQKLQLFPQLWCQYWNFFSKVMLHAETRDMRCYLCNFQSHCNFLKLCQIKVRILFNLIKSNYL